MTADARMKLAAVRFADEADADGFLHRLATALKSAGKRVAGSVQRPVHMPAGGPDLFALQSISSGEIFNISQNLGPSAKGCKLDPQALALHAGHILASLSEGADLLIVNRFGKAESEGQGLRGVILSALDSGVPVLVAVRDKYWPAWLAFAGNDTPELPAREAAIAGWLKPDAAL